MFEIDSPDIGLLALGATVELSAVRIDAPATGGIFVADDVSTTFAGVVIDGAAEWGLWLDTAALVLSVEDTRINGTNGTGFIVRDATLESGLGTPTLLVENSSGDGIACTNSTLSNDVIVVDGLRDGFNGSACAAHSLAAAGHLGWDIIAAEGTVWSGWRDGAQAAPDLGPHGIDGHARGIARWTVPVVDGDSAALPGPFVVTLETSLGEHHDLTVPAGATSVDVDLMWRLIATGNTSADRQELAWVEASVATSAGDATEQRILLDPGEPDRVLAIAVADAIGSSPSEALGGVARSNCRQWSAGRPHHPHRCVGVGHARSGRVRRTQGPGGPRGRGSLR